MGTKGHMWFALATPVVVMVAAVLMESVERHCLRTPGGAVRRPVERAALREASMPVVAVGAARLRQRTA
ncbi:hypothetical protein DMP23_14520 [Amycolatopsis sp. A1MSW2902]